MVARSGSFGLLRLRYEIADERVTITRNVWLPLVLLALAAPGAWCLVEAFTHKKLDGTLFGLGFVGTMLGLFALVMTPWLTPGRITFTREGVTWGGTKYPRQAIASVSTMSNEMRSTRYARYLSWTIVVVLTNRKTLVLSLGNRNIAASTEPLTMLGNAITSVLG